MQRKGLVYMPYSTCSSGMFVVANVIMNIIKKLRDSIDKLLTALGAHDSWLWERLLFKKFILVGMKLSAAKKTKAS